MIIVPRENLLSAFALGAAKYIKKRYSGQVEVFQESDARSVSIFTSLKRLNIDWLYHGQYYNNSGVAEFGRRRAAGIATMVKGLLQRK